jgi:hypothetical protein
VCLNKSFAQLIAAADSYRRKLALAMTPAQRIARCEELTRHAFAQLHANPDACQAFLKRNHGARRRRPEHQRQIPESETGSTTGETT